MRPKFDENTESEAVPTLIRPWSPSKSRQLPCADVVASLGVLAPLRIDQSFASGSLVCPDPPRLRHGRAHRPPQDRAESRHRSMKCSCAAERSFSSAACHLAMNLPGSWHRAPAQAAIDAPSETLEGRDGVQLFPTSSSLDVPWQDAVAARRWQARAPAGDDWRFWRGLPQHRAGPDRLDAGNVPSCIVDRAVAVVIGRTPSPSPAWPTVGAWRYARRSMRSGNK